MICKAAIVAAVRTFDRLPEVFTIEKVGMGAGKRTYNRPSMLRAMLIREGSKEKDTIVKLETNVDDCTGECLGYNYLEVFRLVQYYCGLLN